jgi:hypothetical protein
MDTQDGFIVGVYNYCDRWCERCSLTGRCRVFAEEQRLSFETQTSTRAELVPSLRSLGALAAVFQEAGLPDEASLPDGRPQGAAGAADHDVPLATSGSRPPWPDLPPTELRLHARVREISRRLLAWLVPEACAQDPVVRDSAETLQHFGYYIGPKVYRALKGRQDDDEEDDRLSDARGSAKAALIAFDRIGEAWLRLSERGAISVLEAEPVLTELQSISAELESLFRDPRGFVRPGFDEPEALAMLEWHERG